MTRVRLTVAYDGTDFSGFAVNEGVATVGGALTGALSRVLGHEVSLTCAGRTDKGVHAWGQVVSFDAPADTDLQRLRDAVNRMLGPTVVVRAAASAAPDFDARFSASWRRYRYTIVNRDEPDPFLARYAWHVPRPLDRRALTLACDPLIGEHDFSSFCRRPSAAAGREPPSLVRRVQEAVWRPAGDGSLHFEIQASAFCHQMVRSIVGTLVEVGSGRRKAGEIMGVIRARDRHAAGAMAPAHGLCLRAVGYDRAVPARGLQGL
jgi:tRNA pseudouridine38-40 synthase